MMRFQAYIVAVFSSAISFANGNIGAGSQFEVGSCYELSALLDTYDVQFHDTTSRLRDLECARSCNEDSECAGFLVKNKQCGICRSNVSSLTNGAITELVAVPCSNPNAVATYRKIDLIESNVATTQTVVNIHGIFDLSLASSFDAVQYEQTSPICPDNKTLVDGSCVCSGLYADSENCRIPCLFNYTLTSGSHYCLYHHNPDGGGKVEMPEAIQICSDMGGSLLEVENYENLSNLSQYFTTTTIEGCIWTGALYENGDFRWPNGQDVDDNVWESSEPNNSKETCACVFSTEATRWRMADVHCDSDFSVVCMLQFT